MNLSPTKSEDLLPKIAANIPITIHRQLVKCGRRNCRCASGRRADRHFAQYAYWREDGRIRKCYLTADEAPVVQRLVDEMSGKKRHQKAQEKSTLEQWRDLTRCVRAREAELRQQQAASEVTQEAE